MDVDALLACDDTLGAFLKRQSTPALRTGIPPIDCCGAGGGGLRGGEAILLCGGRGSGKTHLCLTAATAATSNGGGAVYFDCGGSASALCPIAATQGAVLRTLQLVRPTSLAQLADDVARLALRYDRAQGRGAESTPDNALRMVIIDGAGDLYNHDRCSESILGAFVRSVAALQRCDGVSVMISLCAAAVDPWRGASSETVADALLQGRAVPSEAWSPGPPVALLRALAEHLRPTAALAICATPLPQFCDAVAAAQQAAPELVQLRRRYFARHVHPDTAFAILPSHRNQPQPQQQQRDHDSGPHMSDGERWIEFVPSDGRVTFRQALMP